jgi:hypothetical protein
MIYFRYLRGGYLLCELTAELSMLGGSLVTMAWRVLRLRMEKASRYGR